MCLNESKPVGEIGLPEKIERYLEDYPGFPEKRTFKKEKRESNLPPLKYFRREGVHVFLSETGL